MSQWGIADLERRLANMVRIAIIEAVDHTNRKVRVTAKGFLSAWLPWPTETGRNFRRWRPLRPGQQVVLIAPSGDLTRAVIAGMLYSQTLDAPDNNENRDTILFDDGTCLQYDSADHHLYMNVGQSTVSIRQDGLCLSSGGSSLLINDAGITLKGARIDLN
ncbi:MULTISPECIES: phage baseplate assembly protein V [unclassified Haematospirillum]|uniref:phage baseplate assembly protein V n=1 Tax=unclassified Haematospirillum TaxID=2622088 RepID=UPI001439A080|nr:MULTISPECIES: phage baseplate assembly protein V [unclassified Haematospirillum]NKD56086.1 phage baseplate assembly protein V [Haematospirillum sp. H4890]NKD76135.1 phage baseplate assembly protein V [Haematospirillum sp. H4485]NKD88830.1 phage baseplate assembly protein V [Haematospirillum sp. 15-248]